MKPMNTGGKPVNLPTGVFGRREAKGVPHSQSVTQAQNLTGVAGNCMDRFRWQVPPFITFKMIYMCPQVGQPYDYCGLAQNR